MVNFFKFLGIVILSTPLFFSNKINAQGKTCSQATPFCTSVGVPFTYPNIHDASTAPGVGTATNPAVSPFYGCICPSASGLKNPNWFFVKSTTSGAMTYNISQSNGDVDFVAWGPFTSTTNICNQLTGTCASTCSVSHPSCSGGIMDCSFSIATTEAMTLNATAAGQYFMIMITNYQGGAGDITITQTAGNPSDCSITCPPSTFTMVAANALSPYANVPNGSTVNCSQPFFIDPPDLTPAGASYNPYTDQLTPCLGINFNPYTTNLDTKGTVNIFENGSQTNTLCPTCPNSIGAGGTTAGTNLTWYIGYNDPSLTHGFQFCKATTTGAVGPTTVSIRNCWTNTVVLAGPTTWSEGAGSATCFSLNVPAGTSIGTANYSITPSAPLYDSHSGWAYIDPSLVASGTTYTVTYTFNNGVCGDLHGYYVFSVPGTPSVTAVSSQTVCSGNSVSATNFTTNPAGGSINWTNNNAAVGTATAGTSNIAGYTAPTVAATTIGIYTVTATQSGCNSAPQNFSITINPKPTANAGSTSTLTCANLTATLSGSGGGTYAWTGPSITSGSNTATPVVNGAGTYSLTVTSPAGCASTVSTVAISQNTATPITTAGTTGTITCVTNTINLTSTLAGMNYTWTAPAGSSISSGTNAQNAVGQGGGTYTVNVLNATTGCSVQTTIATNVNTVVPVTTAGTTGSITCTTNTISLTSTLAGMNYTWTAPAGSSISSGTNAQNATGQGVGTYTVKVVNAASGCSVQATVAANVNTVVPVTTAGTTGTITCITNTISLTSTLAGMNYTWTAPAGSSISSGTNAQNAVGQGVGTYTVKVVNAASGCSVQATVAANVNTVVPVTTAGTTGTITCTTNTISLTSTLAGMNYTWTAPAGSSISSGTNAQNATGQGVGTYTVKVMDPVSSCSVQSTIAANVNTVVPVTTAGTTGTITCTTNTISLTSTLAGMNYTWTAPAGSSISSGTNAQNAVGQGVGTYTVKVVNATSGCSVQATVAANVNTVVPVTTAGTTGTITCTTNTISLTSTLAGMNYTWTAPAGSSISSGTNAQNAVGQGVGTYTVKAMDAVSGCSVQSTIAANVNTITPVSSAGTTGTITCTTNTISLTSTLAGMNYTWTAPGGSSISSGTNAQNATGQGVGTYTVKVVNPVNSCSVQSTISANVNTVTPITTANTSGSITCVTNTVSLTSTLAGMNYTWTAPAGSSIASGTNLQNATGQGLGTYTITVLNSTNGCTYTTSIAAIQNTTTPTSVNAGPTQTLICGAPTVTLTGSATPGTATANWLGGVTSPNTFTTTTGSANTYTLQAINPTTGCSITSTVQVLSSVGSPTATANAVTNSITCTNSSVGIGVTLTSAGPVTYQWAGPGISGASTNATATATVAGVYNVTVTNNPGNNCSVQINITVPSNTTAVVASINPASTITCNTPNVTLSANPVGSTYTYTWTGVAPVVSGGSTQNPVVNVGGTYSVAITNTVNGCFGNANITVSSNTVLPVVNIAAPSVTTTCANPTITIVATSTPSTGVTYSWTAPGTGSLNDNTISNPIASGSGIFTVVVTNTASGCSSSLTQHTVQVTPDLAIPTTTLSSNSVSITCANPTPTVSISTTSFPVSYSWSPTAGIVPGTETTSTPSFNTAGSYSVIVKNTTSGCATSASGNVVTVTQDNTLPVATLTLGVNNGTLTCLTTSISITPTITPTNTNYTYSWLPGTGISTPVNQANATFTAAGVYTLAITNTLTGCVSTATASANIFTVIADNTPPTFTLGTTPSVTTTCAFPSATLSATSNADPNSVYTWITPTSNTLTGNPLINSTPGIYTVAVTNTVNGCSSAATGQNTVEVIADSGIPSVTLSATSVSITCADPTPSVAITTTASPVSYNWSPTTGIVPGTETTSTPSFTAPGSYSVVVNNTSSGCATGISSNVVNVVLDNILPVATLSLSSGVNNGTLTCLTTSISITPTITPTNTNYTYSWIPGTGMLTPTNQASATFTAAGVYTLAITNTLTGCVSSATASANSFTVIANNTPPTFTLGTIPSVTTTCAFPSATLSATSNADPNSVYTWITPTSNTLTGNPLINSTAGIYTVAVTNTVNGCSSAAAGQNTVEVIADSGIPSVALSTTSTSITCANPTPSVAITTTASPVSYSWSPTTGIVPGTETTSTPSFTAQGTYSVVVTNTISGCATSSNGNVVTVVSNNTIPVILPFLGAINSATINCITYTATASPIINPPSADYTYTWSPTGTGLITPANQPYAIFNTGGVYTLAVTNSVTGCASVIDAASTFTVINDTIRPIASIVPASTNTIIGCGAGNSVVTLDGSSSTSTNPSPIFTWVPTNTSGSTLAVTTSGTYTLAVLDAVSGCSNTTTYFVAGNTTPPQNVSAGTIANIACGSNTVTLNGTTTSTNVSYSWSGPTGTSIVSGGNTLNPIVTDMGPYVLTVTDNLTGCQSTATVNVSQANVTAAFSADPTTGISPLTVNFTDASTGATAWSWNFGDSNTSATQNPSNVYTTGSYTVTLTASSGSCTSTASVVIVVEDGLTIEIPNVFTPNNDGKNDLFTIKSTGVKEISLQIFNRWGEKLYEFSGAKASWDGEVPNGSKAPDATYFYFVKATGFDGKEIEKHGTVNLFR